MIGKPIKGKSFGGCVSYLLNRNEAAILTAEGVSMENVAAVTRDFNMQRKLNPELGKAVGHTVLSWSEQDKSKLSDKLMIEMAEQYMQAMKITDTQYIIVKHTDRGHPHVHLVFNRVDNNGKTITDQNDYARNAKVCRSLTEAYGLHIAAGKDKVNRDRLKAGDKQRYEIHDAVKAALKQAHNWAGLQQRLQQKGISILFKYKSGTKEVQGISFEKDGIKYKGSAIDRSMSFAGIEKQLRLNSAKRTEAIKQHWQTLKIQPSTNTEQTIEESIGAVIVSSINVLGAALLPGVEEPALEYQQQPKKKKARGRHR